MNFALGFLSAVLVLALAGLFRVRRWRRWQRGRMSARGDPSLGRRWPFRRLFTRLDTSPAQEQILLDEAAALRRELSELRAEWLAGREELATLISEPSLEPSRLEALLASRDARLAVLRRRLAQAVARFHGVLDDAQRSALAALLREGHVLALSRRQRC